MDKDIIISPFCSELHWTINLLLKPQNLALSLLSSETTAGCETKYPSFLQINSSQTGEVRQGDVKPLQDWLLLNISSYLSISAARAATNWIKAKQSDLSGSSPEITGKEAEEGSDFAVKISDIIHSVARGDGIWNLIEDADKAVLQIVSEAKYQGQIDTEAVNIADAAAARIAGIHQNHRAIKIAAYVAIAFVFANNAASASARAASSALEELAGEKIFCEMADFTEKAKNEMEAFKILKGGISVLAWTQNASIAASKALEHMIQDDCNWGKVACIAAHASRKAVSAVAEAATVARNFMLDCQKKCIKATLIPNFIQQRNSWICGHMALEGLRIALPLLSKADLSNQENSDIMEEIFHKDWFHQSLMDKACTVMAASVHADVVEYMTLSPLNAKPFPSDEAKKKRDLDGLVKAFYAGRPIFSLSWKLVGNWVGFA
jgi:hypothetical protein